MNSQSGPPGPRTTAGSGKLAVSALAGELFEVVPIALTIFDRELRVLRVNQAMLALTGLTAEEIVGRPAPAVMPEVASAAWDMARHVLATGQASLDVEIIDVTRLRWPEERIHRVSCYPLRDCCGVTVAVGQAVADVTDQRRAEAERDAVERRLRLLGRASGLVGASLDLAATLQELVELVVPEFTDECVVLLTDEPMDPDARPDRLLMRRVVWAHLPGTPPLPGADDTAGRLLEMRPGTPGHLALTLGRPIHLTFDQEMVDRIAIPGTEDYRRHFGIRSGLAVPLVAGGEFHGVVHFGLGPSGRTYTDVDARTAGELGSRIASAIANARAYARQRTAAVTLQRSVLPGDVPPVEGLDVAWRYEPGTAGTEVGGDWFDVIPLSAGRVALVIGDVMGRGLTAAAAMGQVRAAVRAFAALDLTAADVLTNLDDLVRAIGTGPDGTLVSAIYAIWEPATASITVANAGHLPPVMRDPDGQVRFLDGGGDTHDVILGVGRQTVTETRYRFPAGSILALFTDGLVESATIDIDEGTGHLLRVLARPGALHATADRLLTFLDRTDGYDDDVALLLVHATVATTAYTNTFILTPEPRAAKIARSAAIASLTEWKVPELLDITELLVSELVTNAIRYAATPFELAIRQGRDALYVEVSDDDSRVPRLLHPTDDDEGGRGLQLVAELATNWGARPTSTGKTVWFQLDLGEPD